MTLEEILQSKELALMDLGSVKLVSITGRYIEPPIDSDYYEGRARFIVEVKEKGWFGDKKWVFGKNLQEIKNAKAN